MGNLSGLSVKDFLARKAKKKKREERKEKA
jgi:hypothetical protein